MNRIRIVRRVVAVAALTLAVFVDCDTATKPSPENSPEALSQRDTLTLSAAPEGSLTLAEAAEKWPLGEANGEVVLTGRIFAEDQEPWEPNQTSFLMSVLPEKGHDDPEHADNCPFCKRKAAMAPKAVIQFVDASGTLLPYGAQQLFGLKKNDVVTVRGTIKSFDLNLFIVQANGLYHGS